MRPHTPADEWDFKTMSPPARVLAVLGAVAAAVGLWPPLKLWHESLSDLLLFGGLGLVLCCPALDRAWRRLVTSWARRCGGQRAPCPGAPDEEGRWR